MTALQPARHPRHRPRRPGRPRRARVPARQRAPRRGPRPQRPALRPARGDLPARRRAHRPGPLHGLRRRPHAIPAAAQRRVVVSAGGGLVGEPLLRAAIEAQRIGTGLPMRAIAGPLMPDDAFERLRARGRRRPGPRAAALGARPRGRAGGRRGGGQPGGLQHDARDRPRRRPRAGRPLRHAGGGRAAPARAPARAPRRAAGARAPRRGDARRARSGGSRTSSPPRRRSTSTAAAAPARSCGTLMRSDPRPAAALDGGEPVSPAARALRPYVQRQWKALAGAGGATGVLTAADLAKPWPLALVVDQLLGRDGAVRARQRRLADADRRRDARAGHRAVRGRRPLLLEPVAADRRRADQPRAADRRLRPPAAAVARLPPEAPEGRPAHARDRRRERDGRPVRPAARRDHAGRCCWRSG